MAASLKRIIAPYFMRRTKAEVIKTPAVSENGTEAADDDPNRYRDVVNSLWPSDVIWRQGSWSTLAQVMACCLTAPSHYLNQCWLMISEVLWHSPDSNFTENTWDIYLWNEFEIYLFETVVKSPKGQWVNASGAENKILWRNLVNTMAADDLAKEPGVSSAELTCGFIQMKNKEHFNLCKQHHDFC